MIRDYKIIDLKTEGEKHPIGIGVSKPEFAYRINTACQSWYQKSRQVLVYDAETEQLVWDGGMLDLQGTNGIRYEGYFLRSNHHYYWKALVCSCDGEFRESEKAYFHTGLLHQSDWEAKWICNNTLSGAKGLPIFRKEIFFGSLCAMPMHISVALANMSCI